jgi:hypothetical protein
MTFVAQNVAPRETRGKITLIFVIVLAILGSYTALNSLKETSHNVVI